MASNTSSRLRTSSESSDDSIDGNRPSLAIMIFGKDWLEKSYVANVILHSYAFDGPPPNQCQAARRMVNGTPLNVILTPNLISGQLSKALISQRLQECLSLCGSGPQAIILVANPGDFTKDDYDSVKTILTSMSDQTLQHKLVVKYLEEGSSVDGMALHESMALHDLIQDCRGSCSIFNTKQQEEHAHYEILKKIEAWTEIYHDAVEQQSQTPRSEIASSLSTKDPEVKEKKYSLRSFTEKLLPPQKTEPLPPMNMMLFGRSDLPRTSIGNIILSQSYRKIHFPSKFLKRQADVCGHTVTLVEVPSLANTSLSFKKILQKCNHFISLCEPGINAFLLALPEGHLTDEDKLELQWIQAIFGPRVNDFIMLLHTNALYLKGKKVLDNPQERKKMEKQFRKGYFVLSQEERKDIATMFKQIKHKSSKCFTADMFVKAQIEERVRLYEENKKCRHTLPVIQQPDTSMDCIRIVLIGKTGVGKSATGNTILGKEVFKSAPWGKSETKCCQKETADLNGRSVAVVDTPGLFDTAVPNKDVKREILKCFSYLAPGPHVFLVVLAAGSRMTAEERETLNLIKDAFGTSAGMFIIVLFTKVDLLNGHSIEEYIENSQSYDIENLISNCDGRYHSLNNNDKQNRKQVTELMAKIDKMVEKNGGGCYTNEMFQMAESAIKEKFENMMREREEEIEREKTQLLARFEEDKKAMMRKQIKAIEREREKRDMLLKEKEEVYNRERQRRDEKEKREKEEREAEDKRRRDEEEAERHKWTKTLEQVERKHAEQKKQWESEHHKQLADEKCRASKEQEEWFERLRNERSEFERKQREERRIRDEEERNRKETQEYEKSKLEARVKEAEEMTAEIRKERMKQLKEWEDQRKKEKLNEQMERHKWEEKQNKMKDDFENEKERERIERDSRELKRREQERKERKRIEKQHADAIQEIKKSWAMQEKEWSKARRKENERRQKKDEESQSKIRKLQEEFERETEEEKKRRKKEDQDREEQHMKKLKEIEEQNLKRIEMLTKKYEHEVRTKAEEYNEFLQKHTENLANLTTSHRLAVEELEKKIAEWKEKYDNRGFCKYV